MEAGLIAFRVRPNKPQYVPLTLGQVEEEHRIRHCRKPHNKSRGGCLGCKQRRKKCDERKPACTRCSERSMHCKYMGISSKSGQPHTDPPSSSLQLFWPGAASPPALTQITSGAVQHTSMDLVLLDHFIRNLGPFILGSEYGTIFTVDVLDIAKKVPFLMHSMIALAACHLQHTSPDGRTYRMPEALHTQLASQGLRKAVVHMNNAQDMDSVLTSAMLMNSLAFCYAGWQEDEEERMEPKWQWLRIQIGLKDLIIETKPFHAESIWLPMFIATNTFIIVEPPQNDLDVRLAAFCGINAASVPEDNIYLEFYECLAPLVTRTPSLFYLRLYSDAIKGIDQRFIERLEAQDSKPMLLFAHWLALMCSMSNWWIIKRTKRECWKICRILDRRLKGDDRMLLERPAMACGYNLT